MHLAQLWRYPVKSMRGERMDSVELQSDGIAGDRLVQVFGRHGLVTARTRRRLLGLAGTLGDDGEPLIDGLAWQDPVALEAVQHAAGPETELRRSAARFDVLPLLVATDGAIEAFGEDGRRLRPNLVIGGVDGLAERDWPGRRLRVGETLIKVHSRRQRCVMTTFDPDTLEQDANVLRRIHAEFGGELALNCHVLFPGTLHVGDPVALEDA